MSASHQDSLGAFPDPSGETLGKPSPANINPILSSFFQNQQRHYIAAVLAAVTAFGAATMMGRSPLAAVTFYTGLGCSVGYGVAIATRSQRVSKYVDAIEGEFSRAYVELNADWERKLLEAEKQANSAQTSLDEAMAELRECVEKLKAAKGKAEVDEMEIASLTSRVQEWEANFLKIAGELKVRLRSEYESNLDSIRGEYDQELEAIRAECDRQVAAIRLEQQEHKEQCDRQVEEIHESAQQEIEASYQASLKRVKQRNTIHKTREKFWNEQRRDWEIALRQAQESFQLVIQQIQQRHQQQWTEAAAKYEQLLDEYENVLQSYHPELQQIQAVFRQQYASLVEERDRVHSQLAKALAPKRLESSSKAALNGNKLADFFLNKGIACDVEDAHAYVESDEIWLKPRNATVADMEKHAKELWEHFWLVDEPKFLIDQGCIKVVLYTDELEVGGSGSGSVSSSKLKKPKKSVEDQLVPVESTKGSSTGYFVVGNAGAAKSSVGLYLAGMLTEEKPAMVIVLDPHGKENSRKLWGRFNLPVMWDVDAIERQLYLLEDELDRRLISDDAEFIPLFILVDEVSSLFDRLGKKRAEIVSRILRRLGSEGRKYKMVLICMLHSNNCAALGIDAKQKSNYCQIVLGRVVSLYIQNAWSDKNPKKQWANEKAYPCLIVEGADITLAMHPTHHSYDVVADGNEPHNIKPINQLPLEIRLAKGWEHLADLSRQSAIAFVEKSEPESAGADDGADDDEEEFESVQEAPADPNAPIGDSDVVNRLEFMLHLASEEQNPDGGAGAGAGGAPAPGVLDPLQKGFSEEMVKLVLDTYNLTKSQVKTIQQVWGVPKSGTSMKYRIAKWKFRNILNDNRRSLPGKPWGEDPDDRRTFDEIMGDK